MRIQNSKRLLELFKLALLLWLMQSTSAVAANVAILSFDDWARPRSGMSVVELPAVRQTVLEWLQSEEHNIEIRYPGGDEGQLWAQELRDWLIALGVPLASIRLESGSERADQIELRVVE